MVTNFAKHSSLCWTADRKIFLSLSVRFHDDSVSEKVFYNEAFPEIRNCMMLAKIWSERCFLIGEHFLLRLVEHRPVCKSVNTSVKTPQLFSCGQELLWFSVNSMSKCVHLTRDLHNAMDIITISKGASKILHLFSQDSETLANKTFTNRPYVLKRSLESPISED